MGLSFTDFEKKLNAYALPKNAPIAVGVSGGADSMALTLFLQKYAQKYHHSLVAVTVNHNIRVNSGDEALQVKKTLSEKGISHHVLENKTPITGAKIEEKARDIRYQLLSDYCTQNNIQFLFIAHHQKDQIETFLSRLARGSGIDGLSAIKQIKKYKNITLLRPFLNEKKQDILDFLKSQNCPWVEDEMNQNLKFERVRFRQFIPILEKNGISQKSINLSIQRLTEAKECLDFFTHQFIENYTVLDDRGFLKIDPVFYNYPIHLRVRVLSYALTLIGQTNSFLSLDSIEKLVQKMPCRATLSTCVIVCHKTGIFVGKEPDKMQKQTFIKANCPTKWDRFLIDSPLDISIENGPGDEKDKLVPFIIQKSFPSVKIKKTLDCYDKIDYTKCQEYGIKIKLIKN